MKERSKWSHERQNPHTLPSVRTFTIVSSRTRFSMYLQDNSNKKTLIGGQPKEFKITHSIPYFETYLYLIPSHPSWTDRWWSQSYRKKGHRTESPTYNFASFCVSITFKYSSSIYSYVMSEVSVMPIPQYSMRFTSKSNDHDSHEFSIGSRQFSTNTRRWMWIQKTHLSPYFRHHAQKRNHLHPGRRRLRQGQLWHPWELQGMELRTKSVSRTLSLSSPTSSPLSSPMVCSAIVPRPSPAISTPTTRIKNFFLSVFSRYGRLRGTIE